jgi:hypothetical protein
MQTVADDVERLHSHAAVPLDHTKLMHISIRQVHTRVDIDRVSALSSPIVHHLEHLQQVPAPYVDRRRCPIVNTPSLVRALAI